MIAREACAWAYAPAMGDATTSKGKAEPLRLHIGGEQVREGWKILNIQAKPGVDFVGSATDLSQFADNSVLEIYASHIYEHLGYQKELPDALQEVYRVLKPDGLFRVGVPDLEVLCKLMLNPALGTQEKFHVMRMIMGGQMDEYDFHKVGFTFEIMKEFLVAVGFKEKTIRRVPSFGLFKDITDLTMRGQHISLNMIAMK